MAQSITDRLESLQRLRLDGVLSDDEFQQLKQKLISESLKASPTERPAAVEEHRDPFFSRTIEIDARKLGSKYLPLLLVCGVIITVAAFPLINEGTGNECSALEGSLIRIAGLKTETSENALAMGLATLFQRASNGALASAAIKKRYPVLPPAMGCMVGYYHVMFRPSDWDDHAVAEGSEPQKQLQSASSGASKPPPATTEAFVAPPAYVAPAPTTRPRPSNKPAKTEEPKSLPSNEPVTQSVTPFAASDPLRPIMRTHTIPPYPPISIRLNESGTSLMQVHITTEGDVDDCKIIASSSSERLDQAACDYVKRVWRWEPPTNQGLPTAVTTRVSVKWDLRDAQ